MLGVLANVPTTVVEAPETAPVTTGKFRKLLGPAWPARELLGMTPYSAYALPTVWPKLIPSPLLPKMELPRIVSSPLILPMTLTPSPG